ncbi:MAG: hypothetical protein LBJ63_06660 [Prevotellaceae bacterium]|jgi:hypothetical protein|nr:hypothetical protein [Prevotellaceae bacterium]
MENKKLNLRFSIIAIIILTAAMSRLIPHLPNFAPIGGMALFGAVYCSNRLWAFIIPVVSMWISDLVLNNVMYAQYFDNFVWIYSGSLFVYGAFAFITLWGIFILQKTNIVNLISAVLGASVIFFIVSNFGVWLTSGMYPNTFDGLLVCYIAGIPFFRNTLLGDIFYTGILFATFEMLAYKFPALRVRQGIDK